MSLEKAILKVARQINAYDEASLMSLWEQLAERVGRFEPTEEWEEAALALSMIQGVRMKNQLFNHNLAQARRRPPEQGVDLTALTVPERGVSAGKDGQPNDVQGGAEADASKIGDKRGKLLELKPRKK